MTSSEVGHVRFIVWCSLTVWHWYAVVAATHVPFEQS
jgi:hypothetical protein